MGLLRSFFGPPATIRETIKVEGWAIEDTICRAELNSQAQHAEAMAMQIELIRAQQRQIEMQQGQARQALMRQEESQRHSELAAFAVWRQTPDGIEFEWWASQVDSLLETISQRDQQWVEAREKDEASLLSVKERAEWQQLHQEFRPDEQGRMHRIQRPLKETAVSPVRAALSSIGSWIGGLGALWFVLGILSFPLLWTQWEVTGFLFRTMFAGLIAVGIGIAVICIGACIDPSQELTDAVEQRNAEMDAAVEREEEAATQRRQVLVDLAASRGALVDGTGNPTSCEAGTQSHLRKSVTPSGSSTSFG